jgi:hypothetical protein
MGGRPMGGRPPRRHRNRRRRRRRRRMRASSSRKGYLGEPRRRRHVVQRCRESIGELEEDVEDAEY